MTTWELADLLGVHENDVDLESLADMPFHVILEIARRLDINPADLVPHAAELFDLPRHDRPGAVDQDEDTTADALLVLNALALTQHDLTVEDLAVILDWNPDRVEYALERAQDGAHAGTGTHVLRRASSAHYTVTARMDLLDPDAMDRLVADHPTDDDRPPRRPRGRRELDPIEAQALAAVITESDNPRPGFLVDDYTKASLITAGLLVDHTPDTDADDDGDTTLSLSADVQYSLCLFEPDDLPPTRRDNPWHPH